MNRQWGPQDTGGVEMRRNSDGQYWILFALFSPVFLIYRVTNGDPNLAPGVIVVCAVAGLLGLWDGRKGARFARGHWVCALVVFFLASYPLIVYGVVFAIGRLTAGQSISKSTFRSPKTDREIVLASPSPSTEIVAVASKGWQKPGGGHVGWDDTGRYVGANSRGAMLVIGPPGSGKTAAVLIPSIYVIPGAGVVSSIKLDLLQATAYARGAVGRVFHFDPGGGEQTPPGIIQARWSPLVSIRTWDDARMIATRIAAPMMGQERSSGESDNHFMEKGRDWIEVLLYAAVLGGHSISTVADWVQNPDTADVTQEVDSALIYAASNGDQGAKIAAGQHAGLLAIPDRERGSIKSSMTRLFRIYGSVSAREIGTNPNFDPRQFVRSSDTLYITASPERQQEYAPLIAGLLEEIRYATYQRHAAEEQGYEPKRPHVTFVLDEANNTAPIPLPAIVSEAGGQSLHIIVGIQDLSRARARWGQAADGFLTLFPTKVVLNGVIEPYTLDALSNAAGEYDRMMTSYSESTSYVGQYSIPIRQRNPSYSTVRQKVLHQGDIASLPPGKALLFEGADWFLVNLSMHFADPLWRSVSQDGHSKAYQLAQTNQAASGSGTGMVPLDKEGNPI
ncbi:MULTISPECIES: type IV secretory system conjugative DNA transfer family protein [unclassified Rhodococcus (in: high G+C Gram-positive bacteria)]|uniref:type IV secretory system conjugative DNA transfer family protein n=1 Tax=unclassified Rhodococcus (in: high G+C Gram-positive bacteria) TaxID=192944 RepID=UPI00131FD598|nr:MULTISPECIES: type IV secretory system conjugative DNA transfer family protein [unclassified Rhodococcus (in: high G+C Gram-positive bacteria)]QHE74530.1 Putative traG-family protein [Rhodococcus sp. WAY2]